jgi:hypothetical protein
MFKKISEAILKIFKAFRKKDTRASAGTHRHTFKKEETTNEHKHTEKDIRANDDAAVDYVDLGAWRGRSG